jgi:hypothetical protein
MRDGQVEHQGLMVLSVGDCLRLPMSPSGWKVRRTTSKGTGEVTRTKPPDCKVYVKSVESGELCYVQKRSDKQVNSVSKCGMKEDVPKRRPHLADGRD